MTVHEGDEMVPCHHCGELKRADSWCTCRRAEDARRRWLEMVERMMRRKR